MNHWLLKTEPEEYSIHDLEREGKDVWDGVKNRLALRHMRAMKPGDQVFIYHTGREKAIVGLAEIVSDPYPDPEEDDPRIVRIDLEFRKHLRKSVSLAEVKADPEFRDFELVRLSRLSVMPVPDHLWRRILRMSDSESP
jgi:predicted RNA-binding protein with PUA-like domain